MKRSLLILLSSAWLVFSTGSAVAQQANTSAAFSLQGMLSNMDGTAVSDGNHTIVATVYLAGTTQAVFSQTQTVSTVGGLFTTTIGASADQGTGLHIQPSAQYDLGIAVDGGAELMPHLSLVGTLRAATADISADAKAVGGFGVSTADSARANTVLVLNGAGKLHGSIIDTGVVRAINGASGSVQFQGGGDLSVTTSGNLVQFSFTGSQGMLAFPFSKSLSLSAGAGFSVTNALGASAAAFTNTGVGSALELSALTGSALVARSNGTLLGSPTISVENAGGVSISAVTNADNSAVVKLQNTSAATNAKLLEGLNASGSSVIQVDATGKTTINSTASNALEVTTTGATDVAIKATGGIQLNGPVGTGQIMVGQASVVVNNALARPNSIIIVTSNGTGGIAVPLQVSAQGNGSFVVSVMTNAAAVNANANFSYLIINQ